MLDPLLISLGVLTAAQLTTIGWTRRARDAAVGDGRLSRLRPGWFAGPGAHADVVSAVVRGGCVACGSALALRGAWVPSRLRRGHVRIARRADGTASRSRCRPYGRMPAVDGAIDGVELAFRCLLRCASPEELVVVADSLVHLRLATLGDLERWAVDAPMRTARLLAKVDRAESGLESMVRLRLRARGIVVPTQVRIGAARVDLLVGERLVIECDGAEHHGVWEAQQADRARDRALTVRGYRVVRLTYAQILDDWPAVEQDLLACIRADGHRAPRTRWA